MMYLKPAALDALRRHAEAAYPDECCGVLLGRATGAVREVEAAVAAPNALPDATRREGFVISADTVLAAERLARRCGLAIVGFYHSHPESAPIPSPRDRAGGWAGYSALIVSVADGRCRALRSWRLGADGAEFAPEALVVKADGSSCDGAKPSGAYSLLD